MNYTHKFSMKLLSEMLPFEENNNLVLDKNKIYVLRFDGLHMTKNFLGKPSLKNAFLYTMREGIRIFMEQNLEFKFVYSFSDEISLIIEKEFLEKFDYRFEKILSILTSKISIAFYMAANKTHLNLNDKIRCFDGRILSFNKEKEVEKYFKSRQAIHIACHFLRLKNEYLKEERIYNTNTIIKTLKEKGIDYYEISKSMRYGLIWINNGFFAPYEFLTNEEQLSMHIQERFNFDTIQYFKRKKQKAVK